MVPLKITFCFSSPVAGDSDYPIHLDGLLAWARVDEATKAGAANPWQEQDDLPLAKAGNGDDWVWQASRLAFTPKAPRQLVNQQRKCDPDRFYADFERKYWKPTRGDTPPTINPLSGQQRAYQFYVPIQWMEKAEAWCVGDEARVRELLSRIDHVGKMGRNGFGLISRMDIEVDGGAQQQWKLRVLPLDVSGLESVSYGEVLSTPRAPYWEKTHRVLMREPVI